MGESLLPDTRRVVTMMCAKMGGHTTYLYFLYFLYVGRKESKESKGFCDTLRGVRHSAACMVAGKRNAAMGGHGGAGTGIRRGDVRFLYHMIAQKPYCNVF